MKKILKENKLENNNSKIRNIKWKLKEYSNLLKCIKLN